MSPDTPDHDDHPEHDEHDEHGDAAVAPDDVTHPDQLPAGGDPLAALFGGGSGGFDLGALMETANAICQQLYPAVSLPFRTAQ